MSPSNEDIAQVFENMAALLEFKGDAVFKIRAYQRASRTIDHLPFSLTQALDDGMDLKTIPGIGDAISKKIKEFIDTNQVQALERLKGELPEGILSLMELPGVGPRTAAVIVKELGITSLEDMEKAALDGSLAALPRLGEKTAEAILEFIRSHPTKEPSAGLTPAGS